ncbi:hypothetical protein D3C76_1569170 [compost metagenome]
MHWQYGSGCRGNSFDDALRVEVVGAWVDIDEHRLEVVPQQGMSGGHERIGRGDDFTGNPQRLQSRYQGQGTVGEERDVLDAQILGQLFFKLFMERTGIGQSLAFPDFFQVRHELFQRGQ